VAPRVLLGWRGEPVTSPRPPVTFTWTSRAQLAWMAAVMDHREARIKQRQEAREAATRVWAGPSGSARIDEMIEITGYLAPRESA
jgi:hypothetical protein